MEVAGLLKSPIWLGVGTPRGYGRPVLLIPGFGAPDGSLLLLARWLRLRGYRTYRARIGWNVGCSEKLCGRLEKRLEEIAAETGERVALVGHSRGGILAKALASARPDLVAGIVTLGSPTAASRGKRVGPEAVVVAAMVRSGHLPNLLSWRCATGACGTRFRRKLTGRFPKTVGYVSIYSRSDAIASWRGCRHGAAKHVEVRSSHVGMAHNAAVYTEVGRALGSFAPRKLRRPSLTRAVRQMQAVGRAFAPL